MKHSIIICCEKMDAARIDKTVYETGEYASVYLRIHSGQVGESYTISFCPWCGRKLPFPHEEMDD